MILDFWLNQGKRAAVEVRRQPRNHRGRPLAAGPKTGVRPCADTTRRLEVSPEGIRSVRWQLAMRYCYAATNSIFTLRPRDRAARFSVASVTDVFSVSRSR